MTAAMTDLTREQLEALLDGATQGPWQADGEPWNRIVWSSAENRVCFMAHSNGLDDARDIATSNLVAAAPDLARQLLATMTALAEAQAAQAGVVSSAFEAGAKAVHDEWVRAHQAGETPPRGEPDFSEDASDYASLADPIGVRLLANLRQREANLALHAANLADQLAEARKREAGLVALIRWAHETLWELNPNNYDHDEVCKVNDAAVEVILGLAPVIGETHGYSAEWWSARTGKMRLETGMENIARDMAEGRFPERSEPKMVSDTAALSAAPTTIEPSSTSETHAQAEDRICSCGAGHGSLEGHLDWCDWISYLALPTAPIKEESYDWRSRGTKTEDGYNG